MSNQLALTQKALNEAKDLRTVFELEPFKHNFVDNYKKTTGKDNGSLIFERERVLFMKALQDNKKLEKCDRFTVYASFIELAVSGLTLNDGIAYIIPYGSKAQFQIGWKGRLEQMSQMPEINFVSEPQVVYASELDNFDFELGENPRIIKHKPSRERGKSKDDTIEWVYLIIDKGSHKQTFIMSRTEVLTIRDTYSQTYKAYIADCAKFKKNIGESWKKTITYKGDSFEVDVEPPFWITSEAEAWKKTITKRAYKYQPKTPRQKALDEKIKTHVDHEDGTQETTETIDYGVVNEDGSTTQVKTETAALAEGKAAPTKVKGAPPKKDKPAEPKVEPHTNVDMETGEEIPDEAEAVTEDKNPVDDLPELGDLNSF